MKSRVAITAVLAVLGVLAAAGVTVAAGEIVSRPIGLNGSPDDLGRSLTPSSGAVTTVTVRRTVTGEGRDGAAGDGVDAPAPAPAGGDDSARGDEEGHGDEGHDDEGHDDDDD